MKPLSLLSVLPHIFSFYYFSFTKNVRGQVAPISLHLFPFPLFFNKEVSPQKWRTCDSEHFTHAGRAFVGLETGKPKVGMVPVRSNFSTHQSRELLNIPTPLPPTYTLNSAHPWKWKASRNSHPYTRPLNERFCPSWIIYWTEATKPQNSTMLLEEISYTQSY